MKQPFMTVLTVQGAELVWCPSLARKGTGASETA